MFWEFTRPHALYLYSTAPFFFEIVFDRMLCFFRRPHVSAFYPAACLGFSGRMFVIFGRVLTSYSAACFEISFGRIEIMLMLMISMHDAVISNSPIATHETRILSLLILVVGATSLTRGRCRQPDPSFVVCVCVKLRDFGTRYFSKIFKMLPPPLGHPPSSGS